MTIKNLAATGIDVRWNFHWTLGGVIAVIVAIFVLLLLWRRHRAER